MKRVGSRWGLRVTAVVGASLLCTGPQIVQAASRDARLVYVGKFGPGTGGQELGAASDVEVDSAGNIYVLDSAKSRIQKYDNKGKYLMTIGDGEGPAPGQLYLPRSMALEEDDSRLFVADSGNSRVEVFDPSTGEEVQTFGKFGYGNGELNVPAGIAVYNNAVYVADSRNSRVEIFSTSGIFEGTFGSQGQGNSQFGTPLGIAANNQGIFVADEYFNTLKRFTIDGFYEETIATGGDNAGQLAVPEQIALCSTEEGQHLDLYVADENHGEVDVFGSYPGESPWEYLTSFTGSNAPGTHFAYPQGVGCYRDDTKRSDVLVASTGEGTIYHYRYDDTVKFRIDPNESPDNLLQHKVLAMKVSHNAMDGSEIIETVKGSVTIPHADQIGLEDDTYTVKGDQAEVGRQQVLNYRIRIHPESMKAISKAIKKNRALDVELDFHIATLDGYQIKKVRYTIK